MSADAISRALSCHASDGVHQKTKDNPCGIVLQLSFFFDGFGHDEGRKSIDVPTVSNLAKLYFAHRPTRAGSGVYAFYYEGLAARFPARSTVQVATGGQLLRQGVSAQAAGTPGDVAKEAALRRLKDSEQVATGVSGVLKETFTMRSVAQAAVGLLAGVTLESWSVTRDSDALAGASGSGVEIRLNRALDDLEQALTEQTMAITSIDVAIFGYDRGAAIARGFANKLVERYRSKTTDALEYRSRRQPKAAEIRLTFLGLIDSVSSVAEANPVLNQLPLFKASLKERVKLAIPDKVQRVVHMAAAHDPRFFMRIDRIDGADDQYRHYLYPGCQENVGGGLPPGCLGKSNDFAKLPARRMLAEAYRVGVPVYSIDELKTSDPQVWKAFQLTDGSAKGAAGASANVLYRAYRQAVAKMSNAAVSPDAIQAHTILWIKYLAMRFGKDARSENSVMQWSVKWLANEVRWLQDRRRMGFTLAHESRRQPLRAEEKELLDAWEGAQNEKQPLPPEIVEFFDRFLHDGVALSRLQRAFSEFWKDMGDDYALYLRPRAIEVLDGPGWRERLEEIRERNRRDPKIQQSHADAQARLHQQDEAGRLARDADRKRAGISGYRETR